MTIYRKIFNSIFIAIAISGIVIITVNDYYTNPGFNFESNYSEYKTSVYNLVWSCLLYEKAKTGPITTEEFLLAFDFRPDSMNEKIIHSMLLKNLKEKLNKNPKSLAVSFFSKKADELEKELSDSIENSNKWVRSRNGTLINLFWMGIDVKFFEETENPFANKKVEKVETPIDKSNNLLYIINPNRVSKTNNVDRKD